MFVFFEEAPPFATLAEQFIKMCWKANCLSILLSVGLVRLLMLLQTGAPVGLVEVVRLVAVVLDIADVPSGNYFDVLTPTVIPK